MSDLRLSMATKKLLAAAKADIPSATARANVWAGVSGAIGGAGIAGASASNATASVVTSGGASATKVLAIAGLFGGTLAVGLAAALLKIGSVPAPLPHTTTGPPAMVRAAIAAAGPELMPTSTGNEMPNANAAFARGAAPPTNRTRVPSRPGKPSAPEGALAREASLVDEARSALVHGDPRSALSAIREARALPSHQLVPEELAVEEQAFRAIGQSDEANGIDVQLRLQYPESALAR
jgi:hypothetical protein